MDELIALLKFAVNNKDKFIEWDPDQIKKQWIESAEKAILKYSGNADWFWICQYCDKKNGKEYGTCWNCEKQK